MSDIVNDALKKYLRQLQLHPLRTKAFTAAFLAGFSDAVAQKMAGAKKLQLRRLLLFVLYGFAYSGPFGHFLHKLMDKIFKGKQGNETVAKKVILEQITSSPWNNFLFMMYYGLVIEGRPWSMVINKVKILGHLHMLGKLPHRTLQTLSKKYGPIMSLRLGQVPTVVITSPEMAEQFLKTHEFSFASRPKIEASKYLSYGYKGLVFSQYGAYWRNVRKVCTLQLLSSLKVESFAPLRKREVEAAVEVIRKAAVAGETVNLSEVVQGVMEDVVYKMVLGCNKDDKFDLKGLVLEGMLMGGKFNLADFVPWLGPLDLQGLRRGLKKTSKALDEVLEKIISDHEHASNALNDGHKDFIDILLSMLHQPMDPHDEQNHTIDRTNIKAIVLDMISASFDTSSNVILWALSELLRHPNGMKNLQHELETVVGMERLVEETDLVKLNYLDMVVKETLRLYPGAGSFITRVSTEDAMINGYYIKKNSRVIFNIWAIGRDPKVWSNDADDFCPERFVKNNVDIRGHDFKMFPFGSGRRGCPGINLGLVTVKLVLAQLVHCFNWELPLGMSIEELDMREEFAMTLPRATQLFAVPEYRLLSTTQNL